MSLTVCHTTSDVSLLVSLQVHQLKTFGNQKITLNRGFKRGIAKSGGPCNVRGSKHKKRRQSEKADPKGH